MKRNFLFVVLILFIILCFESCKDILEVFDIRGSWDITLSGAGGSIKVLMVFSGATDSGTILIYVTWEGTEADSYSGTYSVIKQQNVNIIWIAKEPHMEAGEIIMDGEFTGQNTMSGTGVFPATGSSTFNWTATRR